MTPHELSPYLEDLECRIDEDTETELHDAWLAFSEGRWSQPLFTPSRPAGKPARIPWPTVTLNNTFSDPVLMLYHQLSISSRVLEVGGGALLSARVNYGTPTVPSMYGAKLYLMPEEYNTLPACYSLDGGLDAILHLLSSGDPDLTAGLAPSVIEAGAVFKEVLDGHPRLARHIAIYHPDLQGPMDICELLAGSGIFTDLIDRPDDVHLALQSITRVYRTFMTRWCAIVPPTRPFTVHWNMLHRGTIMLRDDSATNLSPAMFEEFIKPYDSELLAAFGGGALHFCGRGDRFISRAASIPGLHAVHMSQPELNDLDTVCAHTVDLGMNLIGLKSEAGKHLLESGRALHGRVHCWDGIPK
jgi:hypothetical protein